MKIWSIYENEVDKTWYDSSNILYSECDDVRDSLKVVKITFSTGRVYKYIDVNVNDYLMFREATSQGKAFNTYLRKYKCERLEDVNLEDVTNKMQESQDKQCKLSDIKIKINDNQIEVIKNDNSISVIEVKKESIDDIEKIINAIKIEIKHE